MFKIFPWFFFKSQTAYVFQNLWFQLNRKIEIETVNSKIQNESFLASQTNVWTRIFMIV